MIEQPARGRNIYYRGYVIHEDIRRIHYTIYGLRPHRMEMASVGDSREAMQWIDQDIEAREAANLMTWPSLFPTGPLPGIAAD